MKFLSIVRTAPAATPVVSTADAKLHLRVDNSDDDDYIDSLIAAATDYAQEFTGLSLITQGWTAKYKKWPDWCEGFMQFEIPRSPTISIDSLKYYDVADSLTTIDSGDYLLEVAKPAQATLSGTLSRPSLYQYRKLAIELAFQAGFGPAATDVPQQIIQAILLMISHFYEIRMPVLQNMNATKVPFSAQTLLKLYRVRSL